MRVALKIAYNGTSYLGSQTQKGTKNTILGQIEHLLCLLGIQQKLQASGRTDKGVHATGQICHLDLPPFWNDLAKLQRVLNEMLPSSISIRKVLRVDDDFHARYSAKKRLYRYIIKEGDSNPFEEQFVTFIPSLNYTELEQNIQLFKGTHDFSLFMKSGSKTTTNERTIYKAFTYRYKNYTILYFQANGFLRSQIRLMVGALLQHDAKKIQEMLQNTQKHKTKPAPSNGLYLAKISY